MKNTFAPINRIPGYVFSLIPGCFDAGEDLVAFSRVPWLERAIYIVLFVMGVLGLYQ